MEFWSYLLWSQCRGHDSHPCIATFAQKIISSDMFFLDSKRLQEGDNNTSRWGFTAQEADGYGSKCIIYIHLSRATTKKCVHFDTTRQPARFHSILFYTPSNNISRHQRLKPLERLNATFLKTKSKWCEFEVVPWSTQLNLEIVGQARQNSQIKIYIKCKHIKCALGPIRCTKVYYVQNNHPVLGLFCCSHGHPCAGSILDLHRSSKGTILCRF